MVFPPEEFNRDKHRLVSSSSSFFFFWKSFKVLDWLGWTHLLFQSRRAMLQRGGCAGFLCSGQETEAISVVVDLKGQCLREEMTVCGGRGGALC